jgi:two-component system, OmpR family, sensor histidine kinase SenX3
MIGRALQRRLSTAEDDAARAAIRATEAGGEVRRLRRTLDVLPEGIVVCGDDGEVLYRNRAAQALVDARGADVLVARALGDLLDRARLGVPHERSVELFGPPPRTLTIEAGPITGGTVAVIRDVTDRHHLDAVRRDFVANVSHELRTPVGALALLAETLADEDDLEVVRRLAGRISREVARAEQMIADLLDLSRIESDEEASVEPVAAGDVVAAAVDRVLAKAGERGVAVTAGPVDAGLQVATRRGQLVIALGNLLDNAVAYCDAGRPVEISVRLDNGWIDFIVRDEGIGIPGKDLERIFERFYRVDRARSRDTGGTGLGLSIVRHVAHNHGGTVSVVSREGEGSTFVLRIPKA